MKREPKPYCKLASCINRRPTKQLCLLGLRRASGECPEYRPKEKKPVPVCTRQSCVHFYLDDWKKRCRLGLRMPEGECEHYIPKPGAQEKGVPYCTKSSCLHNCFSLEHGSYRCRIGLSRKTKEECPEYRPKKG